MVRLKRFIRPALVISVLGHAAPALVLLPFLGAHPVEPPPHDAMVVDIVPPDEAPRFEGTPSDLRSSGSQSSSASNSANAAAQPPPPESLTQSPQQQPQQHANPRRDGRETPAQIRTAEPVTAQAEMVHTEAAEPEAQKSEEQIQTVEGPGAPPQPPQEQPPPQPSIAEMATQFALAGGPLGGGFAAPAVNTAEAAYDWTAAFRERVSSCSSLPSGVEPGDKVGIRLRIFLNRDGTVAAPPQLLEPTASRKQLALLQSARDALQRCQPYTMLPPEKYRYWKRLDFYIVPLSFAGR